MFGNNTVRNRKTKIIWDCARVSLADTEGRTVTVMWIREARIANNISLKEIAEKLGCNAHTLARYETGQRRYPEGVFTRYLAILANEYDISPCDLEPYEKGKEPVARPVACKKKTGKKLSETQEQQQAPEQITEITDAETVATEVVDTEIMDTETVDTRTEQEREREDIIIPLLKKCLEINDEQEIPLSQNIECECRCCSEALENGSECECCQGECNGHCDCDSKQPIPEEPEQKQKEPEQPANGNETESHHNAMARELLMQEIVIALEHLNIPGLQHARNIIHILNTHQTYGVK